MPTEILKLIIIAIFCNTISKVYNINKSILYKVKFQQCVSQTLNTFLCKFFKFPNFKGFLFEIQKHENNPVNWKLESCI